VLSFQDAFALIFLGTPPAGLALDAITQATPLDVMRQKLDLNQMISEIRQSHCGDFGGRAGNGSATGSARRLYLLARRVITWHIPASMLGAMLVAAGVFWLADPETHPSRFHLFSGGAILGAFFIATTR